MEHDPKALTKNTETDVAALGSNQRGMRAYDERLIPSLVRQTGAMSKVEIARKTRLSVQTAPVNTQSLEADGLLERHKPVRGKIGQPSVPPGLAKYSAFFFGLKASRRSLELNLSDFLGEVRDMVSKNHPYVSRHSAAAIPTPNILEGSIGPNAPSLCAASLPLSERFLVERKAFLKGSAS